MLMIVLSGISVYKGIETASAYLHQQTELTFDKLRIEPNQIEQEINRFESIHKIVLNELEASRDKAERYSQQEEQEILSAHLMMAEDPMLISKIKTGIQKELCSLEQAVKNAKNEIMKMFYNIPDDYLKARAADVDDVTNHFLEKALGITPKDFSNIKNDVILIAQDLKPSELSQITGFIKGILLEQGSQTSHAAIIAKAKGIPTIVGITGICSAVQSGDMVILDSIQNKIYINPDSDQLTAYQKGKEILNKKKEKAGLLKDEEAVTKDHHKIKLYGNIGTSSETFTVKENGGRGIGLFRTEFLFMNSKHFPTEEEQFREYKKTIESGFEEVIIRTLDIGGDKSLPYYHFKEEENPFLGFRAIRFSLANPDIFKTQLRAILKASAYGKTSIMFPMISCLDEVLQGKALLEECKTELKQKDIPFDPGIRIGIMIEIPAAVTIADLLIEEVDFFSIGTNDLCQYSLAVDRMNKEVAYLYQPLHPGILRMIKQTVEAAHNKGKEAGICGEMAGDAMTAIALIGFGIDELSMSPAVIPEVKSLIRQTVYEDMKRMADSLLLCKNSKEIITILEEEVKKYDY